MKAFELYNVWESFNRMIEDPTFSAQMKLEMGVEWINSLPPSMLCTVSKSSREAIELAMKGRLTDIGNKNGRNSSKEEKELPASSQEGHEQGKARSGKKPVRKDAKDS